GAGGGRGGGGGRAEPVRGGAWRGRLDDRTRGGGQARLQSHRKAGLLASAWHGLAWRRDPKQQTAPAAARRTVTVVRAPSPGRDQRMARRPGVERTSYPSSRRAPLPACL